MNDLPRQKLCELIDQYGHSLCDDPRRCGALLKDYCGQYKQEIFVLVNALEKRVAEELINTSANIPQSITLARLIRRLEDELGLTEAAAKWAVESWAIALGVIVEPTQVVVPTNQNQIIVPTNQKIDSKDLVSVYYSFYRKNRKMLVFFIFLVFLGFNLLLFPEKAKQIVSSIIDMPLENPIYYMFFVLLPVVLLKLFSFYKKMKFSNIINKASADGDLDTVRILLEKFDVNIKDNHGRTALMYAAKSGHVNIVNFLINDKKADVNAKDKYGQTILMQLAFFDCDTDALIKCIKKILETADVNIRDKNGRTALIYSAIFNNTNMANQLIEIADVNIKDNDGNTALSHAAMLSNCIDVLKILSKKSNIDMKDNDGYTALMRATTTNDINKIKILMSEKVDVNIGDKNGKTALMQAAFAGHTTIVQALLEKADVNARDKNGQTALMAAAMRGHTSVVQALLAAGANVNTTDNDGLTALICAATWGHIATVQALLAAKADVNIMYGKSTTALASARINNHTGIVRLLLNKGAT